MAIHTGMRGLGLAVLCVVISGCVSPYVYDCGAGCGPVSLSGRYAGCGGTVADDCDAVPCGPTCGFPGFPRLGICDAGCGRMYWGEWAYDPPDACDPCNDCGDWVGRRAAGRMAGSASGDSCAASGTTRRADHPIARTVAGPWKSAAVWRF